MNYWSLATKGRCPAKHPGTESRWNTGLLREGIKNWTCRIIHYFKGAVKKHTHPWGQGLAGQTIGLFACSLRDVPLKLPCEHQHLNLIVKAFLALSISSRPLKPPKKVRLGAKTLRCQYLPGSIWITPFQKSSYPGHPLLTTGVLQDALTTTQASICQNSSICDVDHKVRRHRIQEKKTEIVWVVLSNSMQFLRLLTPHMWVFVSSNPTCSSFLVSAYLQFTYQESAWKPTTAQLPALNTTGAVVVAATQLSHVPLRCIPVIVEEPSSSADCVTSEPFEKTTEKHHTVAVLNENKWIAPFEYIWMLHGYSRLPKILVQQFCLIE